MTFDISKYAGQIAQATQARVSRDNIAQGDHILQIEGVKGLTSQNDGSDYIIIEASIASSSTMQIGTPVKHMYKLTGVPAWKQKGNIEALKSFVCAVLPPEYRSQVTAFYRDWETDRKSTRLNSSHLKLSRMPSSA